MSHPENLSQQIAEEQVTAGVSRRKQNGVENGHLKISLWDEAGNVIFLVILYCLQGVPLGLSVGSLPFLLQANSSYTSIGLFGIAAYPYSWKLFWSPVVDSVFFRSFGRRKSWIVPLQLLSAVLLFIFADAAEEALVASNIVRLSALFFVLIFLAATQDIAVDGWALTLLSRPNLGYTSTCQTVGMNAGFFLSFTVFLAFNDKEFCNRYFRKVPNDAGLFTLSGYMKSWALIYAVVTLYIVFCKHEKTDKGDGKQSLRSSYSQLWQVLKLPAVLRLTSVLLLCRLGSMVTESAAALKLLEKGVATETLAGIVLLEFPIELFSAVLAGKWVSGKDALNPFLLGYYGRLLVSAAMTCLISVFPDGVAMWTDAPISFLAVLCVDSVTSFVATLMFTAQGAFFSQISDPEMGGAYLTLLNAISNMGSTIPRIVIFWLLDFFTRRECELEKEWRLDLVCPSKKDDALGSNPCTEAGGVCLVTYDGFYRLSYALILLGCALGYFYFAKTLGMLKSMPTDAWHAKHRSKDK